ncbi:MAG: ZIP family metal transporter [Desulfovibrio sp.]|nr:ZIP family metal transporter [Desulfovibrio sp.]
MNAKNALPWLAAVLIPVFYAVFYAPYGMDTTDFGYFYGYGWRVLNGQIPYRDFAYIKPALPLYWHALWMAATPEKWLVLGGKLGFMASMLASSWFGALYLAKIFDFNKLRLSLPPLATCGFVFGVHSFPAMPWHTPDGVLFASASLLAAVSGYPFPAGILAACALLCKQSFLFVPAAVLILLIVLKSGKKKICYFVFALALTVGLAIGWLIYNGAFAQFRAMTTGQLAIAEALDAGILIYLRQNWLIPLCALLPWAVLKLLKKSPPPPLSPCFVYLVFLAAWYIYNVFAQKTWIGFGASWPTLFMILGGIAAFFPGRLLEPWTRTPQKFAGSVGLCAALVVSWSVAVSGGYKIPAFFATPLVFSFFLFAPLFRTRVNALAWATLLCGLVMFGAGYRYPYVFPIRTLNFSDFKYDAGEIFPRASGVMVDGEMAAKLAELKQLRAKYGPGYKTLPGFTLSYFLNADYPVYGSDWLIDWEINGEIEKFYKEALDKELKIFMEKDQMDAVRADHYERAAYGIPQLIRKNWKIIDETPHFIVLEPPDSSGRRIK